MNCMKDKHNNNNNTGTKHIKSVETSREMRFLETEDEQGIATHYNVSTWCSSVGVRECHLLIFSRKCQFYHSYHLYHPFISQENHSHSNAQMHTRTFSNINTRKPTLEHRYISLCPVLSQGCDDRSFDRSGHD